MNLELLIALAVVQYAPASLREVTTKYLSIQHEKKKSFCCGFKLLRKKPTHGDFFYAKYPIEDIDNDENKNLFVVLCDHSPCRNTNAEIEFTLGSLCLNHKIDKDDLNRLRPVSYFESLALHTIDKSVTPNYGTYNNGCW